MKTFRLLLLMVVPESVRESVFSKGWDHSYKHESFTITGSEGVPAGVCYSIAKASGLTRNIIGNVKCNWVFFESVFKTLLEMSAMKSLTKSVSSCKLWWSLFLVNLQVFTIIAVLVSESLNMHWKEIWSTECCYRLKKETSGL